MKTIINRLLNNQASKSACRLMFGTLAVLMVSCNDNLEVAITPDIPVPTIITYDTAEGIYGGDILGNGTAFFMLDMFNSSNPNIGISIMGFCTLPGSFANFKLDAGTYNIASTGNIRTLYPGMIGDDIEIGTYCYNTENGKMTWITSGSIAVSQSGNEYTIYCYFTGEDTETGNAEENLRFSYTGTIDFVELPFAFDDIKNSTYVATGTPRRLDIPDPNTWTGTLEVVDDGNGKKYKINNWANRGNNYYVFCTYRDGKIYLDNKTRVAYNTTYDGYFHVGYLNDNNRMTLLVEREYEVSYNKTTRILDFSGILTSSGKTYPALVGIAAFHNITDDFDGFFSDFYEDLKLQLTPIQTNLRSAIVQPYSQIAELVKDKKFIRQLVKPITNSTPTAIILDKLEQTNEKTISLQKISEE